MAGAATLWILILSVGFDTHLSVAQIGPFADQKACVDAGKAAAKKFNIAEYVCVPDRSAPTGQ